MNSEYFFGDGDLTYITEKDGKRYTVTAQAKSAAIKVEREDMYVFGDRYLPTAPNTSLEVRADSFTIKEEVIKEKRTVTRTARIEAADRTLPAMEKARVAVGAPSNAKFRVVKVAGSLDKSMPVEVEFYWKETV